jgi:hypothetical protein
VVPSLRDDTGWFQQHAEQTQRRIDLDCIVRLDLETLGTEAIALLDTPFGKPAVLAHVPFTDSACRTRHGIGPSHNTDNEVLAFKPRTARSLLHPAERFVSKDEAFLSRLCRPIFACNDFSVGPADAKRHRLHCQHPL